MKPIYAFILGSVIAWGIDDLALYLMGTSFAAIYETNVRHPATAAYVRSVPGSECSDARSFWRARSQNACYIEDKPR